jgi:ferric-dicitrate binding protein FerR (iron transport regulator)
VFVVLLRAFHANLITHREHREYYAREERRFLEMQAIRTEKNKDKKRKIHYARSVMSRNSPTVAKAAVVAAMEGLVPYRDAARLLNVGVPQLRTLFDYMSGLGKGGGT